MSKAIAIAKREIQERWMVLLVAAGVALAPFFSLVVPGGTLSGKLEVLKLIGSGSAASFLMGLALLLGAGIIGREAREKRLSFYFARPVSGASIWFGKMVGALFLLLGAAVVMYTPPLLLPDPQGVHELWSFSTMGFIGVTLAIAFALVPLNHAAATMLRSRSMLVAIDFVAAVIFIIAAGALLQPLIAHVAIQLYFTLLLAMGVAIVIVLLAGGAWQLANGRTDLKRSHRMLSGFVWSALAVVLVILAAVMTWITSVAPEDLRDRRAFQVENGGAVFVTGKTVHRADYMAAFAVDAKSGRTVAVSPYSAWGSAIVMQGTTLAWFEPKAADVLDAALTLGLVKNRDLSLMTVDLSRQSKPRDTGITMKPTVDSLALSEDGTRVAIHGADILTIFDLGTGKNIGAARVPGRMWTTRVQFLGNNEVRVYSGSTGDQAHITAWSFLPSKKSLKQLLDYTTQANWFFPSPTADGKRLIVRINRGLGAGADRTLSVATFDLTTGKLLNEVSPASHGFLRADGSLAALATRAGGVVLTLYDPSGAVVREVQVASRANSARIVGMIDTNTFAVATATPVGDVVVDMRSGRAWTLHRVDLATGAVTPIAKDVGPVLRYPYGVQVATPKPNLQQPMVDVDGHVVLVDLATGARRKLI